MFKLGKALAYFREKTGFTQEELARATGLKQPTICAIERDPRRSPTLRTIEKLLFPMNISLSEFFSYDGLNDLEKFATSEE